MLAASSAALLSSSAADALIDLPPSTGAVMEDAEKIGGGGGGNRWPREETLALLKIRSDMDAAFRDSSLKGPLWEEVSRKMAELGFQRSAKKCKEKFENVYKYHKRTKDGRASKSDGKTYRFFDQLEALDQAPPAAAAANPPPRPPQLKSPPPPMPTSISMVLPINSSPNFQPLHPPQQSAAMDPSLIPPQIHTFQPENLLWDSTSSSSTSSDEDIQRRRGKKRKWKDFFQRLMRDVIQKQEELQKKFLETLEKRERDRMAREEAWRMQEITRMNREQEILAQERSMAAAKDAAVISFLQKISDQHNLQIPISTASTMPPPSQPPPPPRHFTIPPPIAASPLSTLTPTSASGGENSMGASSSRWPKSEVQALIQLRKNMEIKYQESGPKGPLWEEISAAMAKLGYSRNAKRCKEKWENINKYFKKVKESNKKRPEDSKTCPYYHLLDAIYKEKEKEKTMSVNVEIPSFNLAHTMRPAENSTEPIMALPEQQWPQDHSAMPTDPDQDVDENEEEDEDDNVDEDDDDDGGGAGGYEVVTNKTPPPVSNAAD